MSLKEIKKLARRYAMTGGYEIELSQDLSDEQINQLAEIHIPELANYQKGNSTFRSNNSFRILEIIYANPSIRPELSEKIKEILLNT